MGVGAGLRGLIWQLQYCDSFRHLNIRCVYANHLNISPVYFLCRVAMWIKSNMHINSTTPNRNWHLIKTANINISLMLCLGFDGIISLKTLY